MAPSDAESLKNIVGLMRLCALQSALGSVVQGRLERRLQNTPQFVQGFEGSALDGAIFLGDHDFSGLTGPEKLLALRSMSAEDVSERLIFIDWKSGIPRLADCGEKRHSKRDVIAKLSYPHVTDAQDLNASILPFAYMAYPGLLVMVPHAEQRIWREFWSENMFDMPVPSRLTPIATSIDELPDFFASVLSLARTGHLSETVVNLSYFSLRRGSECGLLAGGGDYGRATERAFWKVYFAVKNSPRAQELGLLLDFAQFPVQGDGKLGRWIVELKDGLVKECEDGTVELSAGPDTLADEDHMKRRSPMNPSRMYDYLVLFGTGFLYWLPWSLIDQYPEWWTAEATLTIDGSVLAAFRVSTTGGNEWFTQVYDDIIASYPGKRKVEIILPESVTALYLAKVNSWVGPQGEEEQEEQNVGGFDGDDLDAPDDFDGAGPAGTTAPGPKSKLVGLGNHIRREDLSYKFDRLNRQCARAGRGVFIFCEHGSTKLANWFWIDWFWSREDQEIFAATPGKLPLILARLVKDGIPDFMPCVLIRTALRHRDKVNYYPGATVTISALRLEEGRFPYLLLVDCDHYWARYDRRSCLLIPSEFIETKKILHCLSKRMPNEQITSARDYLQKSVGGRNTDSFEYKELEFDVEVLMKYGVRSWEFMAREDGEIVDGIRKFSHAHQHQAKLVPWYVDRPLLAHENYTPFFKEFAQALEDRLLAERVTGAVDEVDEEGMEDEDV